MPNASEPLNLPTTARFHILDGQAFVAVTAAAKLSAVHPIALETAGELLKAIGGRGCAFSLETPELQDQALAIEKRLVKDLRKSVKKLEPNRKIKVKSQRSDERIVFWFSA